MTTSAAALQPVHAFPAMAVKTDVAGHVAAIRCEREASIQAQALHNPALAAGVSALRAADTAPLCRGHYRDSAETSEPTQSGGDSSAASEERAAAAAAKASKKAKKKKAQAKRGVELSEPTAREKAMAVKTVRLCYELRCPPIPGTIKHLVVMTHPREEAFLRGEHWSIDKIQQICEACPEELVVSPAQHSEERFRVHLRNKETGVVLDSPVHFVEPRSFVLPKYHELEPFVDFFASETFLGAECKSLFDAATLLLAFGVGHLTMHSPLGEAHGIVHYCVRTKKLGWDRAANVLVPFARSSRPKLQVVAPAAKWEQLADELRCLLKKAPWNQKSRAPRPLMLSEVKHWLCESRAVQLNEADFGHETLKALLEDPRLRAVCLLQDSCVLPADPAASHLVVRNTFFDVASGQEPQRARARSVDGRFCTADGAAREARFSPPCRRDEAGPAASVGSAPPQPQHKCVVGLASLCRAPSMGPCSQAAEASHLSQMLSCSN